MAVELRTAIMRTSRILRSEGRSADITPSQLSILSALKRSPATLSELSERERVQPPSITRTVARLVERGLVERSEHPTDGRQVLASLSLAGRALLDEARSRRTEWLTVRLAELEADEREVLARAAQILQRMSGS